MNTMIEIVLEFILLGAIDAIPSKRAPIVLRVLLAIILLTIYVGLVLLLLTAGIQSKNAMLVFVACIVFLLITILIFPKLKRIKKQRYLRRN